MNKYTIENDTRDSLLAIGLSLTLHPYVVMLALGALGHRIELPFLFRFGFLECILLNVVAFPIRGAGFTKKIIKPAK